MQESIAGLVPRVALVRRIATALEEGPVCVLLGARQSGKTTLARMYAERISPVRKFDLESEAGRAALSTPELTLSEARGLVVIDEIQRIPDLFRALRPLADRDPNPARFLILGSASPQLVRGVSESLAGRAQFLQVPGFSISEVGRDAQSRLWLRGGFPRAFLASSDKASIRWRGAFITAFLERDIPQLGIRIPPETLRRFWNMLCHCHGQIWNASEIARSMGITEKTARHYLDILSGTFVIRILPPWFENIGKRQYKSPKVYLRDSGLLHALMGIGTMADISSHPKYGASWEGFALEQILMVTGDRHAYFWGTQAGAELDLMVVRGGKRYGFEFKCQDAPRMTKSMHIALESLGLERIWVVYPGVESYPMHARVQAVGLPEIATELLERNPGLFA